MSTPDPRLEQPDASIPTAYETFNPGADAQRVLSLRQLSTWLRLPESRLATMANEGEIPGRQVDGEWRFGAVAVNRWLQGLPPERDGAAKLADVADRLEKTLSRVLSLLPPPPKGVIAAEAGSVAFDLEDPPTLEAIEYAYIAYILERSGGNKTICAEVLGIDPSTLYRKLSRTKE